MNVNFNGKIIIHGKLAEKLRNANNKDITKQASALTNSILGANNKAKGDVFIKSQANQKGNLFEIKYGQDTVEISTSSDGIDPMDILSELIRNADQNEENK